MGLFDFLKRKAPASPETVTFPATLGAVAGGRYVPMEELPDQVFSSGLLGPCCGVEPTEGKVYAPISGKITQLPDTLHAVIMEAGDIELLIHVGMDTVEMNGDGFVGKVKQGDSVNKGDLLLTLDLEKVRAAGHSTVLMVLVTNSEDFDRVEFVATPTLAVGDPLIRIEKE